MNVRKQLNGLLAHRGYEIVKTCRDSSQLHPEHFHEADATTASNRGFPGRKHVWIIAPPKSGSTWLSELLAQLLRWEVMPLVKGYDRREQEVDIPSGFYRQKGNFLSPHQHCRASQPTLNFIQQFKVTPVILTRNIFDSVISLHDHLSHESLIFPMALVDEQFLSLNEEQQYDFIIAMFLPWYFNFYSSWFSAVKTNLVEPLFISYENLVADAPGTLRTILDFTGESRSDGEIQAALEAVKGKNTRKNKGISGRGNRMLTTQQKSKIQALRNFYRHIDFSSIGLD